MINPSMSSLREMKRGTGISLAHLSRVLSGKNRPSIDCIAKIASYLGITMEEMYNRYDRERAKVLKAAKKPVRAGKT